MGNGPYDADDRRAQGAELPQADTQLQAPQPDLQAVGEGAEEVDLLPSASEATATGAESGDFGARTTRHVDTLGCR